MVEKEETKKPNFMKKLIRKVKAKIKPERPVAATAAHQYDDEQ